MNKTIYSTTSLALLMTLCVACGDSSPAKEPVLIIEEEDHGHHHEPDMTTPDQDMDMTEEPDMVPDMVVSDRTLIEGAPALTSVYKASAVGLLTTGLEFNPQVPGQLWIIHRWPPSEARCDSQQQTRAGCGALEGSVTILDNPGEASMRAERRVDPNGWHFMRRPTGMAFGVNNTFASCGEERTGNYLDDRADFIGPTLWSSDLAIFAKDPGVDANGDPLNGSHLDMLHETPFCMGIAHEKENIYWTFNGQIGALDRYDFKMDHGPGYHDHSDGELYRYAIGQLKREPGVPSHMVYHKASGKLYIADTGNGRVVRLDPNTGTNIGPARPVYEPLAMNQSIDGATLDVIVAPGTLTKPSGLVIHQDVLYVSDNATGQLHAFDLDGAPKGSMQTPLVEGALSAMTVGPDNKLYIADMVNSEIWRIDQP